MASRLPSYGILKWPVRDLDQAPRFAELVESNPYLYRVFSDRSLSPLTEDGFVATRYRHRDLTKYRPKPFKAHDVVDKILWRIDTPSALVSASFSFSWSLFEAFRRFQYSNEPNVKIAIMHATVVVDRAAVALYCLRIPAVQKLLSHDHKLRKKVIRLANAQSEVLVRGVIPKESIVAVVSLHDLMALLPKFWKEGDKPMFQYQPGAWETSRIPQIRTADADLTLYFGDFVMGELVFLFAAGDFRRGEMKERSRMGARLAFGIMELQDGVPDASTSDGYKEFVKVVLPLAFELAHFPCARYHLWELTSHLKKVDVMECLHDLMQDAAMRSLVGYIEHALETDLRFREWPGNSQTSSAVGDPTTTTQGLCHEEAERDNQEPDVPKLVGTIFSASHKFPEHV